MAGQLTQGPGQTPVLIMNQNAERDQGAKVQRNNVMAAKAVADIIRTTLGPRAMLKMILDPMGGIVMTNDGNAILREIDVTHPAAKSMIELARTQDENVGDGTTSVIIVAGEVLHVAEPFLDVNMHPTVIVRGFTRALNDGLEILKEIATPVDVDKDDQVIDIIRSTIGTKFSGRYGDLVCKLALKAVKTLAVDLGDGKKDVDVKRFARVERIPGGELHECRVLDGILINKDITHPRMKREIDNPRVVLLDCGLEYKKGESQTNIEMSGEMDFEKYLQIEEDYVKKICNAIIALKPDIVCTEKGCTDLAQHFLMKAGISVLRRLRKTDNNRLAKATGATIGHRPELMKDKDVGTLCGKFIVRKIGDEYFSFFEECKNPKACSIILRGGSKEVLQELDRNLQDAMGVAKNLITDPYVLPGGGATEMQLSARLHEKSEKVTDVSALPYRAVATALEVIPRTLVQNCGAQPIKVLTQLRAKHTKKENKNWGVDGCSGTLVDMAAQKDQGVWDTYAVKAQTIKTAIESATLLLRIDDIVSGLRNKEG